MVGDGGCGRPQPVSNAYNLARSLGWGRAFLRWGHVKNWRISFHVLPTCKAGGRYLIRFWPFQVVICMWIGTRRNHPELPLRRQHSSQCESGAGGLSIRGRSIQRFQRRGSEPPAPQRSKLAPASGGVDHPSKGAALWAGLSRLGVVTLYPDLHMPDLSAGAAPEPPSYGVGRGVRAEHRDRLCLAERALMATAAFGLQAVVVAHGFVEGIRSSHA